MKSVRIELITLAPSGRPILAVDVVCDCGANGLVDETNWEASFKHRISVGCGEQDKTLVCPRCGKSYHIQPSKSHVHVSNV